ncbi:ferredoxin [Nocardia sp. alder85J]|uniref:ferredoxin n=1 Tax=Nocardia sp. alder85J TaxID=2862949 RepID=UPI001CD7CE41|nr:ferredoxin [Nocardia sp. alder85J]MCX4090743.1 ferredoxin [Nocardia sp. alder85J]
MKASVDWDRCRGHGVCTTICPEVFVLSADGYAEVPDPAVPVELEAAARNAADACPERAIDLS